MEPDLSINQLSRGEREAETAASRLVELIEEALATVALRANVESSSLEALSDRIERAARDLATALRELARDRQTAQEEGDRRTE